MLSFYTDDNITFLIVFHVENRISNSLLYLVRLPMNRIEYEDDHGVTQTGPDATVNTPQFNINTLFGDIIPTITYSDAEGEAGTATTATILFNQPVSGVDISDLTIADGTLGDLTVVSASRYTVPVTPSTLGDGTLTLTFAEDGTYEGNAEGTADLAYTGGGTPNNAPSFQDASYSFPDVGIAVNTVVGTVAATDADNDPLSYSLTGSNASNFAIDSDGEITVAVALTNSQVYSFNVVADDQTDTTSVAVTVTAIAAVVTLVLGWIVPTVTVGNTFPVTLTSNLALTGVALGDFRLIQRNPTNFINLSTSESEIDAVTLTAVSGTHNWRIDFTLNGTFSNQDFEIRLVREMVVANGVNVPIANLTSSLWQVTSVVADAVLDITADSQDIEGGASTDVTFSFDKVITGFTADDVDLDVGTKGTLTDNGDNTFTMPVTAPSTGDGNMTVSVATDVVSPGNNADSVVIAYTEPNNAPSFQDASYSFPDVGIAVNTVVGTVAATDTDPLTYSLTGTDASTFAISSTGQITVSTALTNGQAYSFSVVADDNTDTTSVGVSVTAIAAAALPTATITFNPTSVRGGRTSIATIVWSESVTGFDNADVSVDVGTLGNLTGSGATYNVPVTAPATGSGDITLTIRQNAVSGGNAAETATLAYTPLPTVAITFSATQVRGGRTTTATLTFSKNVTGLTLADLSVDVGSVANLQGADNTYTAVLTAPLTGLGNMTLTVAMDAVSEGLAATTASVAYLPLPTVAITFGDPSLMLGASTTVTMTWSENVTGFTVADVSVDIGTLTNFAGANDVYTATLTAPLAGSSNITLSIVADVISVGNILTTATIHYSDAPVAVDASPHNAIVFAYPANYPLSGESRVTVRGTSNAVRQMTDNDYTTYSHQTDVDMDIADAAGNPARVDVISVRCSGVDTHQGDPTGGAGSGWAARAIPTTINDFAGNPVETTIDGFQHDLYFLPIPFTATSVRLRFTGTDIRIYAVMLLEIRMQWAANTELFQISPELVDRTGNAQQGIYRSVLGAEREKWEIDYGVLIREGVTLNENPDEFVHDLEVNGNCAFAREFSEFPDQVYPASVMSDRIQVQYRRSGGRIYKPLGYRVNFRIGEQ